MFRPLAQVRGRDVANVLLRARKRIECVLARAHDDEPADDVRPMLTSVTGQPPSGPAFKRGIPGSEPGCNLTHQCCDLDSICIPIHFACHTIRECQPFQACPPN